MLVLVMITVLVLAHGVWIMAMVDAYDLWYMVRVWCMVCRLSLYDSVV